MEELVVITSKWSVECNATLDELTAQFVGFDINDSKPLDDLSLISRHDVKPRSISEFPQQQLQCRRYCMVCFEQLDTAHTIGLGWNNEKQCEGCGLSDRGSAWKATQNEKDLSCSICTVWYNGVEGDFEDGLSWQFSTKWDARQFVTWLMEHARPTIPSIMCTLVDGTIFDDKVHKFNDIRQSVSGALYEWHQIQCLFFDREKIAHDLEVMETYEPLIRADDSFDETFHCDMFDHDYALQQRYEDYIPEPLMMYRSATVWIKSDSGSWMYIKRRPGELDFNLFCRAYGLNANDPDILAMHQSFHWTDQLKEFMKACHSETRECGKICLHKGWWCWLPRMDLENPDEFSQRVKQFETARATRTKCTSFLAPDGTRIVTDHVYVQEPNETLAEFAMRFHDAPGEELRRPRHGMTLDWAA